MIKTILIITTSIALISIIHPTKIYAQCAPAGTCTGSFNSNTPCPIAGCGTCNPDGSCKQLSKPAGCCNTQPSECPAGQQCVNRGVRPECGGLSWPNYCESGTPSNPSFRIPNYSEIGQAQFKFGLGYVGTNDLGIIVSDILPYAYVFAGLLLFGYLLYGGFHLATSFGSPKAILEAWLIIFRAFVGFILVFASFWLVRIVEALFGLTILGG